MRIQRWVLFALSAIGGSSLAADESPLNLEGTWVMTSAYEVLADGTRTTNYGEHPKGLLLIDKAGRYSLQIFRPDRPKFATSVKAQGTSDEFRAAAMGSSTHFGRIVVDAAKRRLTFKIEASSFPNWERTEQVREYTYENGSLSYAVPASASGNGTIAYSVWKQSP